MAFGGDLFRPAEKREIVEGRNHRTGHTSRHGKRWSMKAVELVPPTGDR